MKTNRIYLMAGMCLFLTACGNTKAFLTSLVSNQNVYKTKEDLEVKRVYNRSKGKSVKSTDTYTIQPENGDYLRYRIVKDGKEKEEKYIYILPNVITDDKNKTIKYSANGNNEDLYYYQIPKTAIITPSGQYLASEHITGMPITIPFKIRLDVPETLNAISVNASIAYAFGYKMRTNNDPFRDHFIRLNPLVIGFSTETYLVESLLKTPNYKGEQTIALNMATGLTFETSKFNLGGFIGWDRMFGSRKDWIYQKKSWLGIGIGYKFDGAK